MSDRLRILSWNVNGLRAAARKGFPRWLAREGPDVLCLQEVRATAGDLPARLLRPKGYAAHLAVAERKGYSGVATWSREEPLAVEKTLGAGEFDREGRMIGTEFRRFLLYNVYFPKGSGTHRDNSRVPYKLAFYRAFFDHALARRRQTGKPLVVVGDFNTAPRAIDLRNPKANLKNSGFLPEECSDLARHQRRGFVDTFRHFHPADARYTWWSQRRGVRERNVGWRIDLVWVTRDLLPRVRDAFIDDHVRGSDHCPVGVTLAW